jgi:hypothetical protein
MNPILFWEPLFLCEGLKRKSFFEARKKDFSMKPDPFPPQRIGQAQMIKKNESLRDTFNKIISRLLLLVTENMCRNSSILFK